VELERNVDFCLNAEAPETARELLVRPDKALQRLPVFRDLHLEGDILEGCLTTTIALLGEVSFPFRARFCFSGETAELHPLESAGGDLHAELAGKARVEGERVCYRASVRLRAHLPEGEKWGGRAFKKMAEAAFARVLERTLTNLDRSESAGLLD